MTSSTLTTAGVLLGIKPQYAILFSIQANSHFLYRKWMSEELRYIDMIINISLHLKLLRQCFKYLKVLHVYGSTLIKILHEKTRYLRLGCPLSKVIVTVKLYASPFFRYMYCGNAFFVSDTFTVLGRPNDSRWFSKYSFTGNKNKNWETDCIIGKIWKQFAIV
jgi:hypothetical protein